MSSAGHVLAMIQTMRNNRNLRKTRDKFFTGLDKKNRNRLPASY